MAGATPANLTAEPPPLIPGLEPSLPAGDLPEGSAARVFPVLSAF